MDQNTTQAMTDNLIIKLKAKHILFMFLNVSTYIETLLDRRAHTHAR